MVILWSPAVSFMAGSCHAPEFLFGSGGWLSWLPCAPPQTSLTCNDLGGQHGVLPLSFCVAPFVKCTTSLPPHLLLCVRREVQLLQAPCVVTEDLPRVTVAFFWYQGFDTAQGWW